MNTINMPTDMPPVLANDAGKVIIINGGRTGSPIGYLPAFNGEAVPVDTVADIQEAMRLAIGTPPLPSLLVVTGHLQMVLDSHGIPVQAVYDPSGDKEQEAQEAVYRELLDAWIAHKDNVRELAKRLEAAKP